MVCITLLGCGTGFQSGFTSATSHTDSNVILEDRLTSFRVFGRLALARNPSRTDSGQISFQYGTCRRSFSIVRTSWILFINFDLYPSFGNARLGIVCICLMVFLSGRFLIESASTVALEALIVCIFNPPPVLVEVFSAVLVIESVACLFIDSPFGQIRIPALL